ncbi:MAG TPA: hypothetical protein DEQ03_01060 [Marinilabiliales bacterium]|nr:hypothetical protein [Marinilabiliales bacterium]
MKYFVEQGTQTRSINERILPSDVSAGKGETFKTAFHRQLFPIRRFLFGVSLIYPYFRTGFVSRDMGPEFYVKKPV